MLGRCCVIKFRVGHSFTKCNTQWIVQRYKQTEESHGGKVIEKKIKSATSLANLPHLLSAEHYERLGKTIDNISQKERWTTKRKDQWQERKEKQLIQKERDQLMIDKNATFLSKRARKRKIKAVTLWAQREHPHIWQHIVQKVALRDFLQGEPWQPAVLLSYEEMEEMRELRRKQPSKWTYPVLARKFEISVIAAQKIVASVYTPTPVERVTRRYQRQEFKQIKTKFMKAIAKREQSRIVEGDLESRYGTLYTPPPPRPPPAIIRKYLFDEANKTTDGQQSESESESDDNESDEEKEFELFAKDSHLQEFDEPGGLQSVYRLITAECKALVAARLENDEYYKREFAREVMRVEKIEQEHKEKEAFLREKAEANKPHTEPKFFNIFASDDAEEEANQNRPLSKINYVPAKPKKIIRWPEAATPSKSKKRDDDSDFDNLDDSVEVASDSDSDEATTESQLRNSAADAPVTFKVDTHRIPAFSRERERDSSRGTSSFRGNNPSRDGSSSRSSFRGDAARRGSFRGNSGAPRSNFREDRPPRSSEDSPVPRRSYAPNGSTRGSRPFAPRGEGAPRRGSFRGNNSAPRGRFRDDEPPERDGYRRSYNDNAGERQFAPVSDRLPRDSSFRGGSGSFRGSSRDGDAPSRGYSRGRGASRGTFRGSARDNSSSPRSAFNGASLRGSEGSSFRGRGNSSRPDSQRFGNTRPGSERRSTGDSGSFKSRESKRGTQREK